MLHQIPCYNATKPPIATNTETNPKIPILTTPKFEAAIQDDPAFFAAACFASFVFTAPTVPVMVPSPIFP